MIQIQSRTLRLTEPLRTAQGAINHRDCFLVRTNDPVGMGEASPLPGWTEPVAETESALEGLAVSARRRDDETLLESVAKLPAARHGVSLALLDRAGRQAEQPLYRTLGAGNSTVKSVPVNATIGDGDRDETIVAAESAATDGFDCLKIKVGDRPLEADLDRIRGVRDRLPDATIRLDANGSWSLEQAERAIDGLAPLDIDFIEQPLDPRDIEGNEALAGRIDIALDESMRFIDPGGVGALEVDTVICKPMALGGIDRSREVATAARAAGIEVVISNTIDGVVARTGALHLAASLAPLPPCGLATAHRLAADLGPDPAPVQDGTITVPQRPGHGVEVDW